MAPAREKGAGGTRGFYKLYEIDQSKKIPRVTLWRKRSNLGLVTKRRRRKSTQSSTVNGVSSDVGISNQTIYPGARITNWESIASIMSLAHNHNGVNKETLKDVLTLIKSHTPQGEKIPHLDSMYKFCKTKKSCLQTGEHEVFIHHTCPECMYLFGDGEEICPTDGCHHPRYKKGTTEPHSMFIELDAEQQLIDFFREPSFVRDLQYRFNFPKDGCIRDIYDGEIYTANAQFVSQRYNLTLLWHTDGVQVYNSKDNQLWPFSAVINELPPWRRFSKSRVLIFGLFYGRNKPDMNVYLSPIVMTLNKLESKGIEVTLPDGNIVTCRVKAIASTMDLPAVAAVRQIHQWNGEFGCGICEHPGNTVERGSGYCRAYPRLKSRAKQRTHASIEQQGIEAVDAGGKKTVVGVKGLSVINLLNGIDMSKHFMVDYMHGTCIGTTKKLMHCWVENKTAAYYIGGFLEEINRELAVITPPMAMRRFPRPLSDLKNFKASEFRDFLIFYGLRVLRQYLPDEYLLHFALFVRGIYLLVQTEVSQEQMKEASILLDTFYRDMEKLYGVHQCTLNAHNIGRHVVDCVRLAGPLFTHSAFFFESVGGDLRKMVTGPQNAPKQIVDGISALHEFRCAVTVKDDFSPDVKKFLLRDRRNLHPLAHDFVHVTAPATSHLTTQQRNAVTRLDPSILEDVTRVESFDRVEQHKVVFETCTSSTKREKRHNDSTVSYAYRGIVPYGRLQSFVRIKHHQGEDHLVFIWPFIRKPTHGGILEHIPDKVFSKAGVCRETVTEHITPVTRQEKLLHAVYLTQLRKKVLFLPLDRSGSEGYAMALPSSFEHN